MANSPHIVDRRLPREETKEQRLDIGRRIYDGEITKFEVAEEYGIRSVILE